VKRLPKISAKPDISPQWLLQMHVHFSRWSCTCTLDLHLQRLPGKLLCVHVTTLIATLTAGNAEGADRVDDTAEPPRLADVLRARFRRGSHRLGDDPRRQWSMTDTPTGSTAMPRSTVGRGGGDVRQRERNPLQSHLRQSRPSWHAT
jgi:hypothetical protein